MTSECLGAGAAMLSWSQFTADTTTANSRNETWAFLGTSRTTLIRLDLKDGWWCFTLVSEVILKPWAECLCCCRFETTSDEWGVDLCYTVGLCRFAVWQHNHEVYPLMVLNEQHVSHRLLYLCTYFPNKGVTPGKKKVYFTSQTWKLRASLVYSLW